MTHTARRLAELFVPAHYTVHLDISKRTERTFTGTVTIAGSLLATSEHLLLHAKELTITKAAIDGAKATTRQGDVDELIVQTGSNIVAGEHTLTLGFSGTITDPMHGLYPCYFTADNKPQELLMTQLEPHAAREVFPCIDEPGAKATFELTLTTEPDITVLSNTPVASSTAQDDALTTTFEQTPRMSTYLLAFVAGPLAYRQTNSKRGVTIRVYATPDKVDQLDYALQESAKILDFYDDYFAEPFPLPKCDLVACPDFAAGAMENWGLCTFREAALLVDPKDSPADTRQYVTQVIAHELSHQWFGDLVTMQWWDDLWLNESFANWAEHYTTDRLHPDWQLWEQAGANEQQYALTRDSLASVQAIHQRVNRPEELGVLFDPAIVYAKGGSLIHMLQEYLGDEVFRQGLRLYMQRHKYRNTVTNDLWQALGEAAGQDVAGFMQPWVKQPGHPVINIITKDGHAKVSQHRFYANPLQANPTDTTVWPVPLLSPTLPDAGLLADAEHEFVAEPADYHLINQGGTGFYHTQYTHADAAKLGRAVQQGNLQVIDRQRLLLDSVALNRAGLSPTVDTLTMLRHYHHESNYAVWLAISGVLGTVRTLINDDPHVKPLLQKFIANLSRAQFERLGWQEKPQESHFDTLLRPTVISNLAYAEEPDITKHCIELFEGAKEPEDIQSDLRAIVYSVAVREQGKPALDKLLDWYRTTSSADERINLCAGISSVRDEQLARESLKLVTTKTVKLQDVVYWFIYHIRNRYARPAAWQWMQDNWAWLKKNMDDHDYSSFAKYSAGAMSTTKELAEYKAFFEPKKDEIQLGRVIPQGIEDIQIRALWRDRDLPAITQFLQKN